MHESQRNKQIKRVLNIMIEISRSPRTMLHLAKEHDVSCKTIRRDLAMVEAIGVPLIVGKGDGDNDTGRRPPDLFSIEHHWMRRFL